MTLTQRSGKIPTQCPVGVGQPQDCFIDENTTQKRWTFEIERVEKISKLNGLAIILLMTSDEEKSEPATS